MRATASRGGPVIAEQVCLARCELGLRISRMITSCIMRQDSWRRLWVAAFAEKTTSYFNSSQPGNNEGTLQAKTSWPFWRIKPQPFPVFPFRMFATGKVIVQR
jgi:hypothetical protein